MNPETVEIARRVGVWSVVYLNVLALVLLFSMIRITGTARARAKLMLKQMESERAELMRYRQRKIRWEPDDPTQGYYCEALMQDTLPFLEEHKMDTEPVEWLVGECNRLSFSNNELRKLARKTAAREVTDGH